MNTVYLGGPMRGYHNFNFPEFDRVAAMLRQQGYMVLSPAEHDRDGGFDETKNSLEGFDMKAALAWDLEAITKADAVIFLPGWEESSGCGIEYRHAMEIGRPVYAIEEEPDRAGYGLRLVWMALA